MMHKIDFHKDSVVFGNFHVEIFSFKKCPFGEISILYHVFIQK